MQIPISQVEDYLSKVLGKNDGVRVLYFGPLDKYNSSKKETMSIKELGYGVPLLVVYEMTRGKSKVVGQSIISTMRISHGFGHDFRSDRINNMIMEFDTWNKLPKHCQVQDLGAFDKSDSSLLSLGQAGEFFILRPKLEGREYYKDLDRIFATSILEDNDIDRAKALANYLSRIHSRKNKRSTDAELYVRKIRDTIGHGECIFGLADSYGREPLPFLKKGELAKLEKKSIDHRWKLKENTSRLAQVHGDFHPWNILFSNDPKRPTSFGLLDRSRGEWGEPADDLCALSINYIFYSLRKYGRLQAEFEQLYYSFINTYLDKTSDTQILEAMPLFYTFRSLVIASPVWYPNLSTETRRKIFNFASNILDQDRFEPSKVNRYIE